MTGKDTPKHIAIVMDGNGRWAQARNLPRIAGHEKGVRSVKNAIKSCLEHKVPALTLFAFSRENWARPEQEVEFLMDLFLHTLQENLAELSEQGVRLRFVGDRAAFSSDLQHLMRQAEKDTQKNEALMLNIAMNYSGRWDIAMACQKVAKAVKQGCLDESEIDVNLLHHYLSLSDLPEPDLFIRTSGEVRISNFMLWQLAYTELYFTELYWPDFDEKAFAQALEAFAQRERRFGRLDMPNQDVTYA